METLRFFVKSRVPSPDDRKVARQHPLSGPRVIAALPSRDRGEHRATTGDPTRSSGALLANICYYQDLLRFYY